MAEVSLHFPEDDHDLFLQEFSTLDSFPYFSPPRHGHDIFTLTSSTPTPAGSDFNGNDDVILEDRDSQVSLVMDLLHQQVGCDEFGAGGVFEENYDVGVDSLDLELRLELGLEDDDVDGGEGDCNCGGFVFSDCGDEFYVARRETGNGDEDEMLRGSSRVGGIMVVGIDSGSDEEECELWRVHVHSEDDDDDDDDDFVVHHLNDDDDLSFPLFEFDNVNDESLSIPLCWDSLQEEEENDADAPVHTHTHTHTVGLVNTDFEWEEVDDEVDERELLSVVADHDEEEESEGLGFRFRLRSMEEGGAGERGRTFVNNLEWEVLLHMSNMRMNSVTIENENDGVGGYFGDQDDIFNATEYELMFGQFAESENAFVSRPPASKVVVQKLPSVILTEEDVVKERAHCAVCKDQIEVGEEGKQLPCSHWYHGDCILPWLRIRNTCPVCRYELPTDDPDYEQRRLRRAARVA